MSLSRATKYLKWDDLKSEFDHMPQFATWGKFNSVTLSSSFHHFPMDETVRKMWVTKKLVIRRTACRRYSVSTDVTQGV